MLKKRIMCVLLSLCMIVCSSLAFSANAENYQGKMYYNKDGDFANLDFDFDFNMLIDYNNTEYSRELSSVAAMFANAAYAASDPSCADMAGANFISNKTHFSRTDPLALGRTLNFDDNYFYDMNSGYLMSDADERVKIPSYDSDTNDVTGYYIGHKQVTGSDAKPYEVIVLSIRGTNGTNAEWSSNFDVGGDCQNYYDMTGEHNEWLNKENHKGFDITAKRVMEAFNSYVENNVNQDPNVQKCILVTGHSRGAGIANLLGKEFEDNKNYKSFTYTFAAPLTTTSEKAGSYKTIWNLVNSDDLVPQLPLEAWGFKTYGQTKQLSVEDGKTVSNTSIEKQLEKVADWFDYNNDNSTPVAVKRFKALANNREELYNIDYSYSGYITESYCRNYANAEKEKIIIEKELEDENLLPFCKVEIVDGTFWGSNVIIRYSPAYLMQMIANMASGVGGKLGRDVDGKYETAKKAFINCYVDGMTDPHLMVTYYVIARYGKFVNVNKVG